MGRSVAQGAFPWHSTGGSGSTWMISLRQHPGASPGTLLLPVGTRSPAGLAQEGWCPGRDQDSAAPPAGFAQLRSSGAEPFSES